MTLIDSLLYNSIDLLCCMYRLENVYDFIEVLPGTVDF